METTLGSRLQTQETFLPLDSLLCTAVYLGPEPPPAFWSETAPLPHLTLDGRDRDDSQAQDQ